MKTKNIFEIIVLGAAFSISASAIFAQEMPEALPAIPSEPLIAVEDEKTTENKEGVTEDSATDKTQKETVVTIPSNVSEMKSLLFSDNDIQSIRSARNSYDQSIKNGGTDDFSESDFLKKLEKVTSIKLSANNDFFTYPQFFLSSIAYYSHDNWVVWVNNEKMTQDKNTTDSGLKVIYIDSGKVGFEWTPERMDKITDPDNASPENPVKVSISRKLVEFYLKPNQTFTSYAMRVAEGKLTPVTISNKTNLPK